MNFDNNKVRKVINYASTRYLSLGKCLERKLMQWASLESYFMPNFDLDYDPSENDPYEKPSTTDAFKQPVSKLYAMSIQSLIPIFDSFSTFLQAEEPLIHILYHSQLRLYPHYFQNLPYLKLSQNQMMC